MSRHKHPHRQSQAQAHNASGSAPGTTAGPVGGQPIVERIRFRAYEISVARNGGPGDELSDWIQAEHEVNGTNEMAHANNEALGDPSTLEIKTRSQPTHATVCGGL